MVDWAKFTGYQRGFTQHSRSWYAPATPLPDRVTDEVVFGYYSPSEGGTPGEMKVCWYEGLGHEKPSARLMCFDDSFATLFTFVDVVADLAGYEGKLIQPDEFCAMLLRHGFKDMTEEVRS